MAGPGDAGYLILLNNLSILCLSLPTYTEPEEPRGIDVTYDDIGGLGDTVDQVREMIELPLRHPELFQRLGIDPPKGVLLHGPPGTGKTLLARAVANESEASFFHIAGPEIMGKYYGESEQRIRDVFTEAQSQAPSIIFIDEIDSIASKREDAGEVERRVVSQLLTIMDGLQPRQNVIVIAATNRPDVLDEALRRPGRFDELVYIPVPDKDGRMQILKIHSSSMPLAEDVDLLSIAERTDRYTGADLENLVRKAGLHALRKNTETDRVSMDDFERVLKSSSPSVTPEMEEEYRKMEEYLKQESPGRGRRIGFVAEDE